MLKRVQHDGLWGQGTVHFASLTRGVTLVITLVVTFFVTLNLFQGPGA